MVKRNTECICTFAQKTVGDGCDFCNPDKALDYAYDAINELEAERDALKEQIAAKDEALRQAAMLADIASDWNLDEIEIDGEMVLTYDLHKRFMQELEGSSATGESE